MPSPQEAKDASVTRRAAIALGANLGDRHSTLERAVELIAAEIGPVAARSRWLETPALIHPDDPATFYPPFLNGVVVARSDAEPETILARLHGIEARLGRDRTKETARWRPRLVDLDLIAVEDVVLDGPGLRLPHPEMQRRDFVLEPLAEVWPDWRHPILKVTAQELLARLRQEASEGS